MPINHVQCIGANSRNSRKSLRVILTPVRKNFTHPKALPATATSKTFAFSQIHSIAPAERLVLMWFGNTPMKLGFQNQKANALTFIEVLVVIATLAVLAAILLPQLTIGHDPAMQRMNCVNNLKQVNLAFRIWEGDNNNHYPMAVSVTNGGVMESIAMGNVVDCFRNLSNELSTTKILLCPADYHHTLATNFDTLNNSNISYFIGLDASETYPQRLLSGDDNFVVNGSTVSSGLQSISTNTPILWGPGRHGVPVDYFWAPRPHDFVGNLGFADGSVAEESPNGLQQAFQQTGLATNRLAIP